jgi:hypothetical protein
MMRPNDAIEGSAMIRPTVCLILPTLLLSACGSKDQPTKPATDDPAMAGALAEPILTDPDLASENGANRAASVPTADGVIPAADMSPQALAAARSAALKLVGGPGAMKKAPQAHEVSSQLPADATLTAAARAAASPGGKGNCPAKVTYTAAWAAKLPGAFPVYPKGAVQEAAGTDDGGCVLRVVNFISPVPVPEVIDFYYTRASGAGYSAQHVRQAGEDQLGGTKGAASYIIYARDLPNGGSSVDLVTSGGI